MARAPSPGVGTGGNAFLARGAVGHRSCRAALEQIFYAAEFAGRASHAGRTNSGTALSLRAHATAHFSLQSGLFVGAENRGVNRGSCWVERRGRAPPTGRPRCTAPPGPAHAAGTACTAPAPPPVRPNSLRRLQAPGCCDPAQAVTEGRMHMSLCLCLPPGLSPDVHGGLQRHVGPHDCRMPTSLSIPNSKF